MSITSPSTPLTPADSTDHRQAHPHAWPCRAAIAVGVLASVTAGGVSIAAASDGNNRRARTCEVDIAENGTRFVIDEAPVFDDGIPGLRQPVRHPGLHLPGRHASDSNGVNPDGSPEFPDKVIGEWSCAAATSSATAPTPPKAPGCSRRSCSPSATTPTPAPRRSSSPATKVPSPARSSPARSPAAPAATAPPGAKPTRNCSASTTAELPTMGINKTVELELARPQPLAVQWASTLWLTERANVAMSAATRLGCSQFGLCPAFS